MAIRPQDVLTVTKLALHGRRDWAYSDLGTSIGLSKGETFNSVRRLAASRLVTVKDGQPVVASRRLVDFLVHGVPVMFYPERGPVAFGVPTGPSAPFFVELSGAAMDIAVIWPWAGGKSRGETLMPIYETVPEATSRDLGLYEIFALLDVLRVAGRKERKLAVDLICKRLGSDSKDDR